MGMARASFRFYEELNDYLPSARWKTEFEYAFGRGAAIGDVVEALGVPHTEIDLILVDGESVDFGYILRDGDRVSVYPVFEFLNVAFLARLRPRPLRTPRFVADRNLGKLTRYLRLLGFDTLHRDDYTDEALADISCRERRILLTRDRDLLKRKNLTHACLVDIDQPRRQVQALLDHLDLYDRLAPFSRCSRCNAPREEVPEAQTPRRLDARSLCHLDRWGQCARCSRICRFSN